MIKRFKMTKKKMLEITTKRCTNTTKSNARVEKKQPYWCRQGTQWSQRHTKQEKHTVQNNDKHMQDSHKEPWIISKKWLKSFFKNMQYARERCKHTLKGTKWL